MRDIDISVPQRDIQGLIIALDDLGCKKEGEERERMVRVMMVMVVFNESGRREMNG